MIMNGKEKPADKINDAMKKTIEKNLSYGELSPMIQIRFENLSYGELSPVVQIRFEIARDHNSIREFSAGQRL